MFVFVVVDLCPIFPLILNTSSPSCLHEALSSKSSDSFKNTLTNMCLHSKR